MDASEDVNAKINQLLIILAEKQEEFRKATDDAKPTLQTMIDAFQSDLQFLEEKKGAQTAHNERVKQLKDVQREAKQLFEKKNKDYGDAFATYGPIGVLVRIGDKIQRLQSIQKRGITLIEDERMRDTLIDLHNYAAMAIMLIDESEMD